MGFIKHKTKSDLVSLSVIELMTGLRERRFSALEVFDAYAFMVKNDQCNAVVESTVDKYREYVSIADENIKKGKFRLLEGIPFLSKMLFCSKGDESNGCSDILRGFKPDYDAFVLGLLKSEGALMLGQGNTDEFGMGGSNKNSCYGRVVSPWKRDGSDEPILAGGSSGGSAAAVAASIAPFALGTDTGGSIRYPAAMCGIVGLRPTYGLCSRWGIMAFISSLDQAGVLTRNVRDAAYLLGIITRHDERDSTCSDVPRPDYSGSLNADVRGMRIGVPKDYDDYDITDDVRAAWKRTIEILRERGAVIVDVGFPDAKYGIPAYHIMGGVEAASNLARYDGIRYGNSVSIDDPNLTLNDYYAAVRSKYFGPEVKRRLVLGYYVLSALDDNGDTLYRHATALRALIFKEWSNIFNDVDVVVGPTSAKVAYGLDEPVDPLAAYYDDIFVTPVNLCGGCGISVPFGLNREGLPIGMHVFSKRFNEVAILNVAAAIEDEVGYKLVKPSPVD